jgi:hypothetical protein
MDFEKSMKYINDKRTICEVVRECCDALGGEDINKNLMRHKLKEIHAMAKRRSKKLFNYSKEWDHEFWQDNPEYERSLRRKFKKKLGIKKTILLHRKI